MVKWFFAQLGLLDEALQYARWVHNYEQEVFKNRPNYRKDVHSALRSGRYKAVKIVRDPWRRAPSGFLILAERGALRKRYHWVQGHWDSVDEWLRSQDRDPALGISFLDHLAMVRAFEATKPHTINAHLSQQFVPGEEKFVREHVPIEGFADWAAAVSTTNGLSQIDFREIADSKHHHSVDDSVTESLGPEPESARIVRGAFADGRFPSGKAFVNARSRDAILQTYVADFTAYGHLYES